MNYPAIPRLSRLAKSRRLFTTALLLGSLLPAAQASERIALLVGVGSYQDARVSTLYGPSNDVPAMQQVLTQRWGFKPENIRTLVNQQATYANILTELNRLKQRSKAGDHVLVYFSGHGTSMFDPSAKAALPHDTGGFVPFDFRMPRQDHHYEVSPLSEQELRQSLIVGKWHLRPIFEQLEKDRMLTIVVDSCYSGNATRTISAVSAARTRNLSLPSVLLSDASSSGITFEKLSEYPYRNTVSIVASKEAEVAADLRADQTDSGRAHGLLTDLLLQVLHGKLDADDNNDGRISYAELRNTLNGNMQRYQIPHSQTPQVLPHISEDQQLLTNRSLFDAEPKLVETSASNLSTLRIRWEASDQRPTALNQLAQITWVRDAAPADFVLRQQGSHWILATGNHDPIADRLSLAAVIQRIQAEQWLRRLQQQVKSSHTLQIATTPAAQGNSFSQDDLFQFQVKSSQTSHVILLNLNVNGQLQLLYPMNSSENKPLNANQPQAFPQDEKIRVNPPYGLDTVIAIGLTQQIGDLAGLLPMSTEGGVPVSHSSVQALQKRLLEQSDNTLSVIQLRTYATQPDGMASSSH